MSDFSEFLQDVFRDFGKINCRKMFGGYGVYKEGTMFGLIDDDILYLKAVGQTVSIFEEYDLPQFEYDKGNKKVKMSYYQAPEEIFDDPQAAKIWADRSFQCALMVKRSKSRN